MAARPLPVPHAALEDDPLGAAAAAVLLRPDQPPLIEAADRQAAVPHRRYGGPELLGGGGDRLGDRAVAIPEPPVGRMDVEADASGDAARVGGQARPAPVDRPGRVAEAVGEGRRILP